MEGLDSITIQVQLARRETLFLLVLQLNGQKDQQYPMWHYHYDVWCHLPTTFDYCLKRGLDRDDWASFLTSFPRTDDGRVDKLCWKLSDVDMYFYKRWECLNPVVVPGRWKRWIWWACANNGYVNGCGGWGWWFTFSSLTRALKPFLQGGIITIPAHSNQFTHNEHVSSILNYFNSKQHELCVTPICFLLHNWFSPGSTMRAHELHFQLGTSRCTRTSNLLHQINIIFEMWASCSLWRWMCFNFFFQDPGQLLTEWQKLWNLEYHGQLQSEVWV